MVSAVGAEYGGWSLIRNGVLQRCCLIFGVVLLSSRGNNIVRMHDHFLISTAV